MEDRDDLVDVDAKGVARPIGRAATQRMQAREGTFHVLPAPAHMVLMRHVRGAPGTESRRCLLAGEILAAGSLCDVASFVGHSSWKGELVVLDGTHSRSIYFEQGAVIGAQSSAEKERLGQVLYRYGVLDENQIEACASATSSTGLRFGEAAVKLGFVTRERLFHLMGKQCEEVFYGMLLVADGTFYFLDGYDEASLSSRQNLSVGALIREGVRRMHETRFFRARIPSDQHVPVRATGRAAPENDPLQVWGGIDGTRSIADLCRALGQGEFEVSRAIFQMVQAGYVAVRPPRLAPEAAVEVYNRAIALILRELDAMDEGDQVREQLASFAATNPGYAELFAGAGPADDGTLDGGRIAANVARANVPPNDGGPTAEERLAERLHEYASYALFLARPHLRRAEDARAARAGEGSGRLSQRVVELLQPITPEQGRRQKGPSP